MTSVRMTHEYKAIARFYGDRKSKRGNIPLINHIRQGLEVMHSFRASHNAMRAFCLHPLVQSDEALRESYSLSVISQSHPRVILLAMLYREVANKYLRHSILQEPPVFVLDEVRHMLIADKVQNYASFLIHLNGKHPESDQLHAYFRQWIKWLNINAGIVLDFKMKWSGDNGTH